MATIDPTSDTIVLVHDESEFGAAGAPARDLSENDIARLAYRRALAGVADQVGRPVDPEDPEKGVITRPDPRRPDPAIVAEIFAELELSGRYSPPEYAKPSKKAAKAAEAKADAEAETPTTESAAPAEKPED